MIRVYPVPAGDYITIEIHEGIFTGNYLRLELLDLSGKCIRDHRIKDLSGNILTINISGIPEGVFILKLFDSGRSYHKNLIKIR